VCVCVCVCVCERDGEMTLDTSIRTIIDCLLQKKFVVMIQLLLVATQLTITDNYTKAIKTFLSGNVLNDTFLTDQLN